MQVTIHSSKKINITINNYYNHENPSISSPEDSDSEERRRDHGHFIEFEKLKLQLVSRKITGYGFDLRAVDAVGLDEKYQILASSTLLHELGSAGPKECTINKVSLPIFHEEKLKHIEILVKSNPIYEKAEGKPSGPTKITNGGCIWDVYANLLGENKSLLVYDKEIPVITNAIGKYEYAIPFPAVTHSKEEMLMGAELIPKTVIFPSNNPKHKETILKHLTEGFTTIVLGFHNDDVVKVKHGDSELFVVKKLLLYRDAHAPKEIATLEYTPVP